MPKSQRYLLVWATSFACLMACILVSPPSISDGKKSLARQTAAARHTAVAGEKPFAGVARDAESAAGGAGSVTEDTDLLLGLSEPARGRPRVRRSRGAESAEPPPTVVSIEDLLAVTEATTASDVAEELREGAGEDASQNATLGVPLVSDVAVREPTASALDRASDWAPVFEMPSARFRSPELASEAAVSSAFRLPPVQLASQSIADRGNADGSFADTGFADAVRAGTSEGIVVAEGAEIRLAQAPGAASATPTSEDQEAEKMGVPPPKRTPAFLRRQSILLEPGEYQVEYGVRYGVDNSTIPIGSLTGENSDQLQIGNASQKRQQLLAPLEFRCGLWEDTQGFLSMPIGYSNSSLYVGTSGSASDTYGIGDLGLGLTRVLWAPEKTNFRMLGFLQASAPTGSGGIAISQNQREVSLGAGYWTLTSGVNLTESYDPLVLFTSLGYTYTFAEKIASGVHIDAGNTVFYQGGMGYAINPKVTCSAVFAGATSGTLVLNGTPLAGTRSELFTLRLACTITDTSDKRLSGLGRTHEPYIKFGLNQVANDVEFGIRWTY